MTNDRLSAGFEYRFDIFDKHGVLVESSIEKNLMPLEGQHWLLNLAFKAGSPVANWYIGLYDNAYTPTINDEMVDFPADAGENVSYSEATRQLFVPGTVAIGTVDNVASKAEFTFAADTVLAGGFMSSSSAKGSTSGVLISAVRFGSPKSVSAGGTLKVTAGFTLASI